MKELTRLRTITSRGNVILSPFVFEEEEARKRMKGALDSFEKGTKGRTELVSMQRYPRTAVWSLKEHGPDKINIESLILHIKTLKLRWEVISSGHH